MDGATRENGTVKRRFESSSSTDSDSIRCASNASSYVNGKAVRRKKVQRLSYTPPSDRNGRRTLEKSHRDMASCSNLATNTMEEASKPLKNIPIWRQKNFKNSPVIVKDDPYAFNFTPPVTTKVRVKPVQKLSSSKSSSRITAIGGKSFFEMVAANKKNKATINKDIKIRKNVTSPHPAFESRIEHNAASMADDVNSNTLMSSFDIGSYSNTTTKEDISEFAARRARSSPRIQLKKSSSETNLALLTPLPLGGVAASIRQSLNRSVSATNLPEISHVVKTPTNRKDISKDATPCTSRKKIISPHPGVRTSPRNESHSTNMLARSCSYSLLPVPLPSKDDVPRNLPSSYEFCSTPVKYIKPSLCSPVLFPRSSPRKKLQKAFSSTNLTSSVDVPSCTLSSESNEDLPQFAFGTSPTLRALLEKVKIKDHSPLRNSDSIGSEDINNFMTPEQSFDSHYFRDVAEDDVPAKAKEAHSHLIPIPKIETYKSSESEYTSCCSSQESGVTEKQEEMNGYEEKVSQVDQESSVTTTLTQGILSRRGSLLETTTDMPYKGRVVFRNLQVFYFDRQQGSDTIPHAGDVAIGMVGSHFTTRSFSLATGRRPILKLLDEDEVSDSEITDESRYDQREGEYCSNLFLDRIDSKERIRILKNCGITVKKNKLEMSTIRESRSLCGCSCRGGICIPTRCECALSGIQCQVDGPANDGTPNTHPCWCTAETCGNPEGRSEFERHKVREHFFNTIKRCTDMEKTGIYCSPTVTRFKEDTSDDDVDITSINLNKDCFLKTGKINHPQDEISNNHAQPDPTPSTGLCNKELLSLASCL